MILCTSTTLRYKIITQLLNDLKNCFYCFYLLTFFKEITAINFCEMENYNVNQRDKPKVEENSWTVIKYPSESRISKTFKNSIFCFDR